MNPTTDPYLSDKQGAKFFGVSVATFWRRVQDGTVPRPVKFGGSSRWPQSWLQQVRDRIEAESREAA